MHVIFTPAPASTKVATLAARLRRLAQWLAARSAASPRTPGAYGLLAETRPDRF